MDEYAVSAASAVTTATADLQFAHIWNPSTTKSVFIREIHIFKTTAGAADRPKLRRTSARGTASTTVTPAAAHHLEGGVTAPPSGLVLDLAWSVAPTLVAGDLHQAVISAGIGAGLMWSFRAKEIEIQAGKGLALVTGSALIFPISVVAVVWAE